MTIGYHDCVNEDSNPDFEVMNHFELFYRLNEDENVMVFSLFTFNRN